MSSSALKRKSEENGKASKSSGPPTKKPPAGHWSLGLKASMEDPELRLHADDMCVIIKDKYPKVNYMSASILLTLSLLWQNYSLS